MPASPNSLPGCVGFHGKPIAPNGPCERCRYEELCIHVNSNFVPKTALRELLRIVQEIKAIVRG